MRYEIRRIGLGSSLRFVCGVGGAIALLPALCIAGLAVRLIQGFGQTLDNMRAFQVQLPDLQVAGFPIDLPDVPIDLISQLDLGQTDQTVQRVTTQAPLAFVALTTGVLLLALLGLALLTLLFVLGYNLVAGRLGGIKLELVADEPELPVE